MSAIGKQLLRCWASYFIAAQINTKLYCSILGYDTFTRGFISPRFAWSAVSTQIGVPCRSACLLCIWHSGGQQIRLAYVAFAGFTIPKMFVLGCAVKTQENFGGAVIEALSNCTQMNTLRARTHTHLKISQFWI